MGATSEHFSNKELACRHCNVNECKPELLTALEAFRAKVGKMVVVNSAYRCAPHNTAVGGASHSEHVMGLAADIAVAGMTAAQLESVARTIPQITGIGRADRQGYIHIDVRQLQPEQHRPSLWCYAQDGQSIPYFPPKEAA